MADQFFVKPDQQEQRRKWADIWIKKFADFHNRGGKYRYWDFDADQVIAFLRSKRDAKVPAWKRMKIIEGLMFYRRFVQDRDIDFLRPLREKMQEIILIERARRALNLHSSALGFRSYWLRTEGSSSIWPRMNTDKLRSAR